MARKKKQYQTEALDIPDYQLESLARVLFPYVRDYLSSEEGQKDYAEWTARRQQLNNKNQNEESR